MEKDDALKLPRATAAVLRLIRDEGLGNIKMLLDSRGGVKHETALRHLMTLLELDMLDEDLLLKLHDLHQGNW